MNITFPTLLKIILPVAFISGLIGLVVGWRLEAASPLKQALLPKVEGVRANGNGFTKPLLLADTNADVDSPALAKINDQIKQYIDGQKSSGNVQAASVYLRDLSSGDQITVNPSEKYFPASLSKVPLLMSYFKMDEDHPGLLESKGVIDFQTDYNAGQELPIAQAPVKGQEYSIQQLLEMMIKYSDNISFTLLISRPEATDTLRSLYQDVHAYFYFDQSQLTDVTTPREYALFLRMLYNATYLNADDSEKALNLMSQTDFKDGIVAGVPKTVIVSHKFGLSTQRSSDGSSVLLREMHDCGIVYAPGHPYLICMMTKSHADIPLIEKAMSTISSMAYKSAINDFK